MHKLFTLHRRPGSVHLRSRAPRMWLQAISVSWGWFSAVQHFECCFRRGGDHHHGMFTLAIPWFFVVHLGVCSTNPTPQGTHQYGAVIDSSCCITLWGSGEYVLWWDYLVKGEYEEAVTVISAAASPVRFELANDDGVIEIGILRVVLREHLFYYHRWYLPVTEKRYSYDVILDPQSLESLGLLGYYPAPSFQYTDREASSKYVAINLTVACIAAEVSTQLSANR